MSCEFVKSRPDAITTMQMGDHELSLEDSEDIGEFFMEKAMVELRETQENKERGLEDLRNLIKKNTDLDVPVDDDAFLLPFLRCCKYYPESAYKRLIDTFKFKDKEAKYCRNLIPSQEGNAYMNNIFTVLPYRDQHGRRILLIEAGKKWNPKKVSLTELIRGIVVIVEIALLEPKTQIAGASIIIDLEGLSLQHVWQFSPHIAKLILEFVQTCIPLRLKAVHIVNQTYLFNMLFAIFKPFIGEKLRNRIYFHGENRASLLEHIDAKFIPTQYGGEMTLDTIYGPELHRLICQFEEEFIEGNKRGFISGRKK